MFVSTSKKFMRKSSCTNKAVDIRRPLSSSLVRNATAHLFRSKKTIDSFSKVQIFAIPFKYT